MTKLTHKQQRVYITISPSVPAILITILSQQNKARGVQEFAPRSAPVSPEQQGWKAAVQGGEGRVATLLPHQRAPSPSEGNKPYTVSERSDTVFTHTAKSNSQEVFTDHSKGWHCLLNFGLSHHFFKNIN